MESITPHRRPSNHWAALVLMLLAHVAAGAATLTEHMDIECRQPEPLVLACEYRILSGAELVSAAAEYDGTVVDGVLSGSDDGESTTAILFLVDTSDPGRAEVVDKNREHIMRTIDAAAANQVFSLAAFDSDLELLCDLPCSAEDMAAHIANLEAKGRTTELYRNVLGAIKHIKNYPAEQRLIIIMSDGLAEDLAYHHEDVVRAARKEKVVISAMGYPRSVAQSIALQTLRRLSEETGGLFAAASHIDNEIPAAYFSRVLGAIENGGSVVFSLESLADSHDGGPLDVSLAFQTTESNFVVLVPVISPRPDPAVAVATAPQPESPAPAIPTAASPTTPRPPVAGGPAEPTWSWFWYGLPAMIFSAILAAAIIYALIGRRRREESRIRALEQHPTPHAFLVSAEDENVRYKIDHTPWRIGRSRNNELPLNDTSISRLHAEIRRDALGQFTVQDLESLNGVFVNGDPVQMEHLDEGDRVEIGDVGFIFTFHDEDYERQEPTVLVRTITPT